MKSKSAIPLAIIGMGCKLPGADNLEQFWKLVVEGRNAVVELPPDRLDQDMYYDPKVGTIGQTYSKLGAIVSSRQFDRQACPIPESLERSVDNAHLLMCQVAADALRHAGIDPFNVPLRNTGVYIGHAQGSTLGGDYTYATYAEEAAEMLREVDDFQQLTPEIQGQVIAELVQRIRSKLPARAADSPDVACSLVAGTISKAFGLDGPFLALNSACASSLQAMLIGARALQLGHIDMAVVGGASDCKSDSLVLFAHARAMSSTGSRPFDESADGLIVGEGYVALVMKTLERALADGDPIQAVVRGLGVSSDGKGKSLWAPRKEGQVLAMQRAYRDGLDFRDLDYVEAHATATQLGDATELNTLAEVLQDKLPPGKKVPITSVKANIGHTLETAGIAGVIKTVLAIQHEIVPPAASVEALNPKIDWQKVPVYVPRQAAPWPAHADGRPRRAGVNAFGIGGLNMHAVIEEFNQASRALVDAAPLNGKVAADDDAVAVIGMGCVLPGARGLDRFWQLLTSNHDPKCDAPPDRWRTDLAYELGARRPFRSPTKRGGFITDFEYDWKTHKIPPKQVQQADPLQFMLLDAADQALKQAGYDSKPFDRARCGVVVGTEFGGDFAFQLQMGLRLPEMERHLDSTMAARGVNPAQVAAIQKKFNKVLLNHWPALIDETGSFSTSSLASRTAKTWNVMGGAVAIDSGHCSGLASLAVSADMLLTGDCDMVICAAGHRRLGLPAYEALALNGMLALDGTSPCPLDAGAIGYLPADGVGVLLLKRLSDARRDGDQIHSVIRGIGAAHRPSAREALQTAIERSLQVADRTALDVGVLEVDGTLLTDGVSDQLAAIADSYAIDGRQTPVVLSSAVGQIGHPESAAGVVSLIKSSLELEHGIVPASIGLTQPNPQATRPGQLVVSQQKTPIASQQSLAAVCSRSRGLTYHAVIEHGAVALTPKTRQEAPMKQTIPAPPVSSPTVGAGSNWQMWRFAAPTPDELFAQLRTARQQIDATYGRASSAGFTTTHQWRAAIVADSAQTLAARLDAAIAQGAQPAAQPILRQQGIMIAQRSTERPQIVFCFPGQGSQYDGMLRAVVEQVPQAAQALDAVEQILERYGYQSFAELAWGSSPALGTKVFPTQLAVLIADWLMVSAVTALGVKPDAMFGHSYGEYAALAASGAFDIETAIALTRARCDGIAAARVQGGLLATTAPADQIAQLARESGIGVHVANFNAPDQTVVGGTSEELQRFEALLKQHKINCKALAVPAPFHTPLMKPASQWLVRALADAEIRAPQVPLWSVVTNRPVASADEVRANLGNHNTSPVMYVDLVRQVVGQRPAVLIEIGPQQVLTNLNRRIVTGEQAYALPTDQPKRPGSEQLHHVRALLEVLGVFDAASPTEVAKQPAAPPAAVPATKKPSEVWVFDATARRREKMRQAAKSGTGRPGRPTPNAPAQPQSKTPDVPAPPAASPQAKPEPPPAAAVRQPAPAPQKPVQPQPAVPLTVALANPSAASQPASAPKSGDGQVAATPDLEKFLINFVVEQTGYPPEVVELDADLEADLGIDSIKKAQLFGELQEYFDVVPTEDLTLDSFPTLRHVLDFLRAVPMKSVPSMPGDFAVSAPVSTAPVINAAPIPAPQQAAPQGDELEKFLINFVVEQTGYPPEVVELDADLEADLGIDSIKKAQLFGELQEYFDVVPTEDLTLDSFPTLRHVLDFLRNVPRRDGTSEPTASIPEPTPEPVVAAVAPSVAPATAVAPAPSGDELEQFLINFVVEQTGYPPEVVELDADLEADLGIDSIKKAQLFGELQEYFDVVPTEDLTLDSFPTLRHVLDFLRNVPRRDGQAIESAVAAPLPEPAPAPTVAPQPTLAVSSLAEPIGATAQPHGEVAEPASDELEQFLINFVVEQTGYPPEVVELDADLEADLGIDSIKKAQLFGELQEYFDVVPTEDLTLDSFPTLRHVLDFLRNVPRRGSTPQDEETSLADAPASSSNGQVTNTTPQPSTNGDSNVVAPVAEVEPHDEQPADTQEHVLVVEGTPYEMGLEQGRRFRTQIRRALRLYADLATDEASVASRGGASEPTSLFSHEELDELQGIADGAEVPLSSIIAHNLAAYIDLGDSNLHFASRSAPGGVVHAAGWTLPLMEALSSVLEPVILVRRPVFGLDHAIVSIVGTVGGLAGVNAAEVSLSAAGAQSAADATLWPLLVRRALQTEQDLIASESKPGEVARSVQAIRADAVANAMQAIASDGHSESSDVAFVSQAASGSAIESCLDQLQQLADEARGGRYPQPSAVAAAVRHAPAVALVGGGLSASDSEADHELFTVLIDSNRREISIAGRNLAIARRVELPPWRTPPKRDPLPPTDRGSSHGGNGHSKGPVTLDSLQHSDPTPAPAKALPPLPPGMESARFLLRTIPQPFPPDVAAAPTWIGAAIVVGDNPLADALETQIAGSGGSVHRVRRLQSDEQCQRLVDDAWAQSPSPHLFLTSARDVRTDDLWNPHDFAARFQELVVCPFFLTQAWVNETLKRKQINGASVVAVTQLGGDFGFSGQSVAPEGGALTGLMKALCLELNVMRLFKEFRAKAIDAPANESPESLARNLLRELAHGTIDYEVAFRDGQRYLQNGFPRQLDEEPAAVESPRGSWIVTGGARGITAECARELGQQFGLRLHLIGSSPVPDLPSELLTATEAQLQELKAQIMRDAVKQRQKPGEAWEPIEKSLEIARNLQSLREAGIDVTYHSCDVSDLRALSAVVDKIRRQGPITGILHGAGIERSCRFEKKTPAGVAATFGSKVVGAYNLMVLTRDDPVRHFLGFGSISGRLGSNGQADYCAASDMLAKLTAWYASQRPQCRATTFHWHPWDEVGMAYRPETRATLQMTNGPTLMPKREGLMHLIREVAACAGDNEVIITTPEYFERYYGPGSATASPAEAAPELNEVAPSDGAAPSPSKPTVAQRNVLQLRPAPLPEPAALALSGAACIIGDNTDAQALAQALTEAGVPVQTIAVSDDLDAFIEHLDATWTKLLPRHLFLMTARDPEATLLDSRQSVARRRNIGVLAPYLAVQRWLRRLAKESLGDAPTLTAVTNLGGDFAIHSTSIAPEGGALAGLLKSVHVEAGRRLNNRVRCRTLDFPAFESPQNVARCVLAELAARATDVEVAWNQGQRLLVEVVPTELPTSQQPIEPGEVWIVTGGARGITAAAALHLGQRYNLRLHLVGSSPVPDLAADWIQADDAQLKQIKQDIVRRAVSEGRSPEEDWMQVKKAREIAETLQKFAAAGVSAQYHSCDIGDWDAVADLLARIRRAQGPIRGVIHGAGYAKSARIEMKSRALLERTVKPKFDGTLALMSLTTGDPLRQFITFGSISGRFGGNGLSDYAAANEALAKMSAWHRGVRPEVATSCLAWQTWDEIGMAMLSDSAGINRNALQMQFIPPQEGVEHLEREIIAGAPNAEVIITDGFFERNFYRLEPENAVQPVTASTSNVRAPAPLVDSIESGTAVGSHRATVCFKPGSDPFLIDHRLRNAPFLPGVIALETLAEAAQLTSPGSRVLAIEDFEIVQGIKFQPDRDITAHVKVEGTSDVRRAALTVEVRDRRDRLVDPARPCAHGQVRLGTTVPKLQAQQSAPPTTGWFDFSYADDALLYHGPRFRYLKQGNYASDGGWGRIVAPAPAELAGSRSSEGWILPVAVLDACVVACGSFIFLSFGGRLEVPYRFEQIRVACQPAAGEQCLLRFDLRSRTERNSIFDFTLFDQSGAPLLDVRGYTTTLVAENAL